MNSPGFPSIFIACPCSDNVGQRNPARHRNSSSTLEDDDAEEEEDAFNPRAARSTFSLFPLENLLFCEDCNQVRCPRCVLEEIVCYFCPSCLFEVPSSTVKSEGNRCTRNCFSCPVCTAAMTVTATGEDSTGPFILLCSHCHWSSADIGIDFEKPMSITTQLAQKLRLANAAAATTLSSPDTLSVSSRPLSPMSAGGSYLRPPSPSAQLPDHPDDAEYIRLKSFYNQQKVQASAEDYPGGGSLSRLMGLYAGGGGGRLRGLAGMGGGARDGSSSARNKTEWREAAPLRIVDDEAELIERMKHAGFDGITTQAQRIVQPHSPRFLDELRPLAALLRTKRSKRCRSCRHILVKPESKVGSIRHRIRLVASSYIPQLAISRLDHNQVKYHSLIPGATHQFLLAVTNPLYDPINITLATPEKTPGCYPATVYILCPEFEVGASTDVWDEALGPEAKDNPKASKGKGKRTGLMSTIYDSGRNWTTVILEIVPPVFPVGAVLTEDDYIVKVPILVRSVYETDIERDDGITKEGRERKEHSYWSVLEVGRINFVPGKEPAAKPSRDGSG